MREKMDLSKGNERGENVTILFPDTSDAKFENTLKELITKCLHSNAVASLEALRL